MRRQRRCGASSAGAASPGSPSVPSAWSATPQTSACCAAYSKPRSRGVRVRPGSRCFRGRVARRSRASSSRTPAAATRRTPVPNRCGRERSTRPNATRASRACWFPPTRDATAPPRRASPTRSANSGAAARGWRRAARSRRGRGSARRCTRRCAAPGRVASSWRSPTSGARRHRAWCCGSSSTSRCCAPKSMPRSCSSRQPGCSCSPTPKCWTSSFRLSIARASAAFTLDYEPAPSQDG